ncbi:hypothetical protein Tco_0890867 [Tanacetum coccineum]|uniref:Uncharacterized protein n=1 Tax=Tanacetum coccineum TaxID=301880 RepID=A0ABQ5C1N0_9ASTR
MDTPTQDPYEAIRQAYLDGTDIESEPFEDPIDTKTPESPLAIAPPIPLSESTIPVLVPILRRTARMVVRVPHAIASGLSTSMAEVAAMSESALLEDSVEDDDEEDEEIEESMDSDSVSEDARDEGPTTEDEGPAAKDEGLTVRVEGPDDEGYSVESNGLGLEKEEEDVPGGPQQAALVVGTTVSAPLGLRYGALRLRELALEEGDVYSTFEVGQGSGSAPESERLKRVSAFRQPTLTTWTNPEDATPTIVKTEGFLTELGAQVKMQRGLIRDHAVRLEELSPALFKRSLEYEQERVTVTFGAIWRPVLDLEAWAGQTDAQRAALWHAISDVQGENRDLLLQLTEERRARLELAKVVDGMRRGQEPKGGAYDI